MVANETDTGLMNEEGVTAAQEGNYQRAIKRFETAIKIQDKNVAVSYNNLGYTYMLAGKYKEAVENYRKAVERNPKLIPAVANLGKSLYMIGEYSEAIEYGERAISLDRNNQDVRNWLPDAYKKAADQRLFELQYQNEETGEGNGTPTNGEGKSNTKKPMSSILYNVGLLYRMDKGVIKFHQYGPERYVNITLSPMTLDAHIWASPDIEITGNVALPDFGLIFPQFLATEEELSFRYHTHKSYYGMGVLFSQSDFGTDSSPETASFINNPAFPLRSDTKLGLIFGSKTEFASFNFSIFSRFLFQDTDIGPQSIEYDRNVIKLEYKLTMPADKRRTILPMHIDLSFLMKINEIFISEYLVGANQQTMGHYFGIYDFIVNLTFGKLVPAPKKTPVVFGFSAGARLYFQEFNETSPYSFGNGQGFFGFDISGAVTGDSFPTFYTNTTLLSLHSKQLIANKLIFTEMVGMEFTHSYIGYHGFFANISIGYAFY